MTSHYPTVAELADFRWRLHEAGPDHWPVPNTGPSPDCALDGPRTDAPHYWPTGRAWPHELTRGCPSAP